MAWIRLLLSMQVAVVVAVGQRPNILHVIVDDLGWGNTNYHRSTEDATPEIQTPNLDALVANGVKLMRHYVHAECTPTRVSFQTGRVPAHSGQPGLCSPWDLSCGIPYNATSISMKMADAGYSTHFVGKWDCGAATPHHTPFGRNYSSALNYFGHGNYQWGELEWKGNGIDFWLNDKPAYALANRSAKEVVYEEVIFREQLLDIVAAHNTSIDAPPLFLTYAARIAHYPIQAPIGYQKLPNIAAIDVPHRMVYHAQVQFLDDQIGNLTAAFKAHGLWNNTLMIFHADNGGYTKELGDCSVAPDNGVMCTSGEAGANNHPLRGGKYSFFEGGIRANSFASGGLLPPSVRGTGLSALMHVADWYVTYATMAGIDPQDKVGDAAGVPPVEGFNMLPVLLGENTTSPRTEIYFGPMALIQGDWKLLTGKISSASWGGKTYPNKTSDGNTLDKYTANCGNGCLYNVGEDMTEHEDLAASQPARVKQMLARSQQLAPTQWTNKWTGYSANCVPAQQASAQLWGGFIGPYCDVEAMPHHPGNFTPTPLKNCTYLANTWISPYTSMKSNASTQEACCSACGMNPTCVAAVFTCPRDKKGPCYCKLKPWASDNIIMHTTNDRTTTLSCLTGRQNISSQVAQN